MSDEPLRAQLNAELRRNSARPVKESEVAASESDYAAGVTVAALVRQILEWREADSDDGAGGVRIRSRAAGLGDRDAALQVWAYRTATQLPVVEEWRSAHLPGGAPVPPSDARAWVEEASASERPANTATLLSDVLVPVEGGTLRITHPTSADGSLGQLAVLARRLERNFGWTHPGEAAAFLLWDLEPWVTAMFARFQRARPGIDALSRVQVTLDPAVTPEELADWWRKEVRRNLKPGSRIRRRDPKSYALVKWAATRPEGEAARSALAEWNRSCPEEWQHPADGNGPWHFMRTVREAVDATLSVGYVTERFRQY